MSFRRGHTSTAAVGTRIVSNQPWALAMAIALSLSGATAAVASAPVPGVDILVTKAGSERPTLAATSDGSGRFSARVAEPGRYTLQVSCGEKRTCPDFSIAIEASGVPLKPVGEGTYEFRVQERGPIALSGRILGADVDTNGGREQAVAIREAEAAAAKATAESDRKARQDRLDDDRADAAAKDRESTEVARKAAQLDAGREADAATANEAAEAARKAAQVTKVDPPVAPPVRGPARLPARPLDRRDPGLARGDGCDEAAQLDEEGHAILPAEAFDAEPPVSVDQDMGALVDLYPSLDTTTDAMYAQLPCEPSIGGRLPPNVAPTPDEIAADDYLADFQKAENAIADKLKDNPLAADVMLREFEMGDCFTIEPRTAAHPGRKTLTECNSAVFLDANMPFEGRDIIYVHGLATQHLTDRIAQTTGPASATWPADAQAFLGANGYFRESAEHYWIPHLVEHLSAPAGNNPWGSTSGWQYTVDPAHPNAAPPVYASKANRYLLVAWSSNQTIEYAQHALMTQIMLAITSNQNVVRPKNFPSTQQRPFCSNGCIIIGHSTGPLITSTALGLASQGHFGPGGEQIARLVVAHVSFDGAISGSRLATLGMAVAAGGAPVTGASNLVCPVLDSLFGTQNTCDADLDFVNHSILRDLMPAVSQNVWGPALKKSPVPTVTFAGGHPVGNYGPSGHLLAGVDDGVITMNSACGNPRHVVTGLTTPSGLVVTSMLKAFDFSESGARFARGAKFLVNQKNLKAIPLAPNFLASACTPSLSAAGMVMPVHGGFQAVLVDSRKRYPNHYSFIQSVAEHSYDGGGSPSPALWPSYTGNAAGALRQYLPFPSSLQNLEESRAVTNAAIYSRKIDGNGTRLVKPLGMHEVVRGRKIVYRMPVFIGNCPRPAGKNYRRCERWIWKRTYHLATDWEVMQASHYAYRYVGRR